MRNVAKRVRNVAKRCGEQTCETLRNVRNVAKRAAKVSAKRQLRALRYRQIAQRLHLRLTGHAPTARNPSQNPFLGLRDTFEASKSSRGPQNGQRRCFRSVAGQRAHMRNAAKCLRNDAKRLRETLRKSCERLRNHLRNVRKNLRKRERVPSPVGVIHAFATSGGRSL